MKKENLKIKGLPKGFQPVPRGKITKEEWLKAINCLIKNIPEETFLEVWELMQKEKDWSSKRHYDLGMWVRNLLRKCGLGWGSLGLDSNWHRVMEDATRKFISLKNNR